MPSLAALALQGGEVVFRDADSDFLVLFHGIFGDSLVVNIRRSRFEPALVIGRQNFLFIVIKLYCIVFISHVCLQDIFALPSGWG